MLNKIEKEQMLWNRFASDSALSAQGGSTVQSSALSSATKVVESFENPTAFHSELAEMARSEE